MSFTVYALSDARDPETIRYIGFTRHPETRLKEHIYEALYTRKRSHRLHWLRGLLREGVEPIWRPLRVVDSVNEAAQLEIAFIAQFRPLGFLVNGTLGGRKRMQEAQRRRFAMAAHAD